MRLRLILPVVEPQTFSISQRCPFCGCKSVYPRQRVEKRVRDARYEQIEIWRYQCGGCRRTFRVYPQGICRDQFSRQTKGFAVVLYLLGLSYGAASLALEAIGIKMGKTTVYQAVQEAAERMPGMRRLNVLAGGRVEALGADVTSVKCKGKWLHLRSMDAVDGVVMSLDVLPGEEVEALKEWLMPIVEALGIEVLVSDDADGFKQSSL